MKEIWKDIPEFDGYQVSNFGRVKSLPRAGHHKKDIIMKDFIINSGYKCVTINKKNKTIHRLVAKAFIKNPYNKNQVNHINGNKLDNHVDNLEWVTQGENMAHSTYILHNGRKNKVICVELGITFESIRMASRKTGCRQSNIISALKGRLKTSGGYHWKYAE